MPITYRTFALPSFLLVASFCSCGCVETSTNEEPYGTPIGSVERLDPRLDTVVAPGAALRVVASGFDWCEGPVWIENDGYVLFSDIPPNRIFKYVPGHDAAEVYLEQSGYLGTIPRPDHTPPDEPGSNGLLLDGEGRLVLCQHGERQVARMDAPLDAPRAVYVPLATHFDGKRFNSPNDAVFHANGDLYFTDPPYGLPRKMEDPTKELPFQGVYRRRPNGDVTLLTRELSRPNGLAFSPDHRHLYVANSDPERALWMVYDVNELGDLENGRVFFDATPWVGERLGLPDGLKVHPSGIVFATGPGGVLVFSPAGDHLGTLHTTQATSNCAFGEGGRALYVTADQFLIRVPLRP